MHNLDIDKKTKQDVSELDLLLMIEMGFFSELKKMKIKFNPRPSSNEPHSEDNKPAASKDTFVDLHLKMVKKIDDLLERHKQEFDKDRIALLKQRHKSLKDVVNPRESTIKPPEISHMGTTFVEPGDFTGDLDQREEFFEIEHPLDFPKNADIEQEQDIHSVMMGNQDKKSSKSFWGLGKIKLRKKENVKDKQTNKHVKGKSRINNITKTKLELEKTKQEIEEKKKALEIAREKGKQKELELKKESEGKKKQEKLKKLELKKKHKLQKIKEKEAQKAEKENKKKLETQKKLKEKEAIKAEKELQQRRKEEEKKKQEKLKKLETQKKLKEKEAIKAEKEKHKKKKTEEQETIQEELQEPADLGTYIEEKKETIQEPISWDEDVEKLLPILDSLFANLPDDIVDEFTQSKDFKLYEKVMLKYLNK